MIEMSILGNRAEDISFVSDADFFEAIGYLAKPGVIAYLEAEIPSNKVAVFTHEFPDQSFRVITRTLTRTGNPIKYGVQYRIYFRQAPNSLPILVDNCGRGPASYPWRINKSRFVEKIVENYGFKFGHGVVQNPTIIRGIVNNQYNQHIADFDRGYNL
jgi:hypothetical protein